jgi:UDP-N-acetylglucosamine 4,6-dehydratase
MNILITGGTGSFGYAMVEYLLKAGISQRICIYSRDEHKQEKMRAHFNNHPYLRFFMGDMRDKSRLKMALQNIQLVFHAAALKVVPSAEYNPIEYIKTNILGAQNLIECLLDGSGRYTKVIALSTDKAVHPVNLYGATKLTAEKLFTSANNMTTAGFPKFSVVRYGNVANSNGSVIPLFKAQRDAGKNITITHPDMTRFWFTLKDAVEFTIRACNITYGGEIFVPVMPSFRIKDLADIYMEEYPLEKQFPIITGIRPGEKLHEEIISIEELENTLYDQVKDIYTINPPAYEVSKHAQELQREILKEPISSNGNTTYILSREELKNKLTELGAL